MNWFVAWLVLLIWFVVDSWLWWRTIRTLEEKLRQIMEERKEAGK